MESKKRRRNDLLLALGILLAAGALLLLLRSCRRPGAEAVVLVDGSEVARYSLSEPRRVTFGTEERHNTLVIEDGKAWVEDATCPDLLCEKQGKISAAGELIVCLPNRLVVQIEGGAQAAALTIGP